MTWYDYAVLAIGFGIFSVWAFIVDRSITALEKRTEDLLKVVLKLTELQEEMDRD